MYRPEVDLIGKIGLVFAVIAFGPSLAHAQVSGWIYGTVSDEISGRRIPLAMVSIDSGDHSSVLASAVTDDAGAFALAVPADAPLVLSARHLAYRGIREGPFSVAAGDTLRIALLLLPDVAPLGEVVVEGEAFPASLLRTGFLDRRRRGWGQFLMRDEIAARGVGTASSLFFGLRGVTVRSDPSGEHLFSSRGSGCRLAVFVDGQQVVSPGDCSPHEPASGACRHALPLDAFVSLDSIDGVEVYAGPMGVPLRYTGSRLSCGAVLIWTRR